MVQLKVLNRKKIKEIQAILEKTWGTTLDEGYAFFMNAKNKIYIVNQEIGTIDLEKVRTNSIGMYFATLNNTELRLSMEGAQLVGPKATKNIYELKNDSVLHLWVRGYDLELSQEGKEMFIVKYNDDYLSCGKLVDGKLINYIPKERRVRSSEAF